MTKRFGAGQKFGKWKVLKELAPGPHGHLRYECECECGKILALGSYILRAKGAKGCAKCLQADKRIKPGKKFGSWTVMKYVGNKNSHYECKCECGSVKNVASSRLLNGSATQCGKCAAMPTRRGAFGTIWSTINRGAEVRGIKVTVTLQEIKDLLVEQNYTCKLSGLHLRVSDTHHEHAHGGTTASLDRIDSTKGYDIDNIQWVYKWINVMKMDYTDDEFIEMCRAVAKHTKDRIIKPVLVSTQSQTSEKQNSQLAA